MQQAPISVGGVGGRRLIASYTHGKYWGEIGGVWASWEARLNYFNVYSTPTANFQSYIFSILLIENFKFEILNCGKLSHA